MVLARVKVPLKLQLQVGIHKRRGGEGSGRGSGRGRVGGPGSMILTSAAMMMLMTDAVWKDVYCILYCLPAVKGYCHTGGIWYCDRDLW